MSVFTTLGSALRRNQDTSTLTHNEINQRRNLSSACSVVKMVSVAALVTTIAVGLFAVIAVESMFLMSLALVFSCLGGVVSYDVFAVAGRSQRVLDNVDQVVKNSKYEQGLYLTQGTVFASSITQLLMRNEF